MKAPDTFLYVDDPMYAPMHAARYLGISPRTLRDLRLKRDPMPGTGHSKWGYRRSTLNRHLAELAEQRGSTAGVGPTEVVA